MKKSRKHNFLTPNYVLLHFFLFLTVLIYVHTYCILYCVNCVRSWRFPFAAFLFVLSLAICSKIFYLIFSLFICCYNSLIAFIDYNSNIANEKIYQLFVYTGTQKFLYFCLNIVYDNFSPTNFQFFCSCYFSAIRNERYRTKTKMTTVFSPRFHAFVESSFVNVSVYCITVLCIFSVSKFYKLL